MEHTLCKRLHLRCLDLHTSQANDAFDNDSGCHSTDSDCWQFGGLVGSIRQEFLNRLLQDLEEGDNHDDRKDKNTKRLETTAADRKTLVKRFNAPLNKTVSSPDDEGAKQVKSGVDKRCYQ